VGTEATEIKVGSTIGYVLSVILLGFGGMLTLMWTAFLSWVLLTAGWRLFS
jgi:hypothetical protein